MSIMKLEPQLHYDNPIAVGGVYFTKRGNQITSKTTVLSSRVAVVEFDNVGEDEFGRSATFRPTWNGTVRELRNDIARYSHQSTAGLSILVQNDEQKTVINNLTAQLAFWQEKVAALTKEENNNKYKLMLSVGDREIADYKLSFNIGDSFILMGTNGGRYLNNPVVFVNISSKKAVVTYDASGRYLKTYPGSKIDGLITIGDIRAVLKEAGFDGLLYLRKDVYANAYRENAIALSNGTAVPHNQLTQQAATNTTPAVTQQQGGKFILWAPNSSHPPRVIMEGRNTANDIANQMHARHGKTFYVAQLVRKVETVTKVVKTQTKEVTDLV